MASNLRERYFRLSVLFPALINNGIPFNLKWMIQATSLLTDLEALNIEKASEICVSVHSIL